MKHEPPRAPSTAKFSAKTKNTEREAANLEVIEGFFTALVKNKDPKAVAGYLADDLSRITHRSPASKEWSTLPPRKPKSNRERDSSRSSTLLRKAIWW